MRGLDLNMSIHNPCTLLWPLCTVLLEQSSSVHKLDPIVELSEEEKGKAVEWLSVVVCGMLASVCMDPWLRSVCSVWACAKVKCWACQTKGMSWKICLLSKHRCYRHACNHWTAQSKRKEISLWDTVNEHIFNCLAFSVYGFEKI